MCFGEVTWRPLCSVEAEGEVASGLLPTQEKLTELQAGKKSLEDQVEMLRMVKEEAEKPEKEAKDQHQKRWEGTSRGGPGSLAHDLLAPMSPDLITAPQHPHAPSCLALCIGHCIQKSFGGIICSLAEVIFFFSLLRGAALLPASHVGTEPLGDPLNPEQRLEVPPTCQAVEAQV